MNQTIDQASDHDAIWLLLPWYVNGRIDDQQRARIDAHLHMCPACRDELLAQRQICQAMATSNPEIEQLPTASFRHLLRKIDAQTSPAEIGMPARVKRMLQASLQRWPTSMAASLAAIVVATLGYVVVYRVELARKEPPADYYTVTSPAPRVPLEVIRAVFAPAVTVADMQRILDEAQLHIVAGPTPAGVYSLAKTSAQPVPESLQRLRQHKEVLFAEPTATTSITDSVTPQ